MDSNTYSTEPRARSSAEYSAGPPDSLAAFTAAAEDLAAQDLSGLPDAVRAERVLRLRRLLDRLEGHWLAELAGVDARGGGRCRRRRAGRLHRRLAAGPAAHGRWRRPRLCPHGPGPVPWPPDGHRPGVDRRAAVARPCQRAGPWHLRPPSPRHRRGRTGAPGRRPAAGPPPAPAGGGPPAGGDRPR